MTNTCDCSRPSGDAFACTDCAARARDNLLDLARSCIGLAEKADMQRSASFDSSPRAAERPLPYNPKLLEVQQAIHANIVGLAGLVWEENPDVRAASLDKGSSTASIAVWLTQFVGWMRYQKWCQEEWMSIERNIARIASVADPPPERIYVGNCSHCSAQVMAAKPVPAQVPCNECGEASDRDQISEELLAKIDGHLGTVREILGLLRSSGHPVVSEDTVQRIIKRDDRQPAGRLTITRKDGRAMAVDAWRVRDIRGLVERALSKNRRVA